MHVNDGDSSKFLLTSLYGETSQKTRSGKNFFDKTKFKAINKATYTYSNGIYAITPLKTGNVSLDIYIKLPAGTYTYSGNGSDATQVRNSSGTTIANTISSSNTTFTITEEGSFIRFNFGTGTSTDAFTLDTNNIQIESGSTATDYEEYGVMPSPDYPSEIENVEGKNLFDQHTLFTNAKLVLNDKGYYEGRPGRLHTLYGDDTDGIPIKKFKEFTSYCISFTAYKTIDTSDQVSFVVTVYYSDGSTGYLSVKATTPTKYGLKTSANRTVEKITLSYGYNLDFAIKDFQIEEGTVATPYVPYNSLEFKVEGKNSFDINNIVNSTWDTKGKQNTITVENDTIISTANYWHWRAQCIDLNCKQNTDYNISLNFTTNASECMVAVLGYKNSTITAIASVHNSNGRIEIPFNSGNYEKIGLSLNNYNSTNSSYTSTFSKIMLEEGSTATDYEPYKSQVAYFPLSEGQKLMEGSYTGEDGIHNARKQVVFDGTESWNIWAASLNNVERFAVNLDAPIKNINTALCSHFKYLSANQDEEHFRWSLSQGVYKQFVIFIDKSKATTVAELKTWLQSNPITVEYELAEPEIVPYTAEQQEAWNKLQSIKLFDGINNINSDAYADIKYNYVYASPSPDCPSEIENLEGRNKFNINGELTQLSPSLTPTRVEGNRVITPNDEYNSYGGLFDYIAVKPNENINISFDLIQGTARIGLRLYDKDKNIINSSNVNLPNFYYNAYYQGYYYSGTNISTVIPENVKFIKVFTVCVRGTEENIYENLQIEKGNKRTPYVPYNSLEFKVEGKNKLNIDNLSNSIPSANINISDGVFSQVNADTKTNLEWYLQGYNSNDYIGTLITTVKNTLGIVSLKFTKTSSFNALRFGLNGSQRNTMVYIPINHLENNKTYTISANIINTTQGSVAWNNMQLEEGTEVSDYEPYKSQTAYFPLAEGQKLMEGSYLAEDGIHHSRKQVVFDGSDDELWNSYAGTTQKGCYVYWISINNSKIGYQTSICSHYTNADMAWELSGAGYYSDHPTLTRKYFTTNIPTLAELRIWLSNNPITVEYKLAEPETVPYTEEQRAAFNSINQLYLFMGQNTIYSDALISAIYITQMTDGITTNYLNILNSKYIDIAQRNTIHPMFKIELLDIYENIVDEITGDISTDTSGSISVNYQQGVRRSISLTFIDTDSRFIPDSKGNLIWANKKFKVFVGLKDEEKGSIYWFPQGVYYFTNATSSRDGANCKTTITGVDKFGKFGSELGYNQLESTYLIPAGTNIYSAIKGILNMDIGNGQPIDPIEPILDPIYIDEVCPYDIKKSPSEYLSEILIELADVLGCDIYYDINGRLRIDNGTIDVSYSNKASIWNFSDILPEYSNSSVSTNFVDFINAVKVVGNNINDQIYEYTAYNNNPESPTRVDLIGKKMRYIDSATVYNEDRAKDYAVYKLNTLSILQLAINFSSTLLPHLDVNKIITITDKHFNYNMQRFIIQSLTIPLSYSELMTINASNVASLPYYEGGNT